MKLALDFAPDPNGHLALTKNGAYYEASLESEGFVLATYRAGSIQELADKIVADDGISLPAHGVWLGRELERLAQKSQEKKTNETP